MANAVQPGGSAWRRLGWGSAAFVLLLPFVAMQFTREVAWTVGDFIFAGLMIGVVGLAIELTVRATPNRAYRAAIGFALAASFLTIWINGAVGLIGSEDNPFNRLFLGVILLALLGAALAGFRAGGMALATAAAAAAQLLLSVFGAFTDLRGGILSALFAGLWLMSAALFRRAAQNQSAGRQPGR
jgi:hypothetical protein